MRIVSNFHDYYDTVMVYGQDDQVTWIRTEEKLEVNTNQLGIHDGWFAKYELRVRKGSCYVNESYIAFCGKIYPTHKGEMGLSLPYLVGISYEDMRDSFCGFTQEDLITKDNKPSYGWRKTESYAREVWLSTPCHALHTKFDCPVLLIEKNSITKCPYLRSLGFQRIKDPYTAFQDISMYISGVMAQKQNPMVTISDKSKILKHGFDPIYGFRKRKKEQGS